MDLSSTRLPVYNRFKIPDKSLYFYRKHRSWGKVIFSEACVKNLSTSGEGVYPIACWDTPPQDQRQTTPPPHGSRHSPSTAVHAGRYGQQAGGTHPTGMHTCLKHKRSTCKLFLRVILPRQGCFKVNISTTKK